jgi:outer membrane receptor protein involved in Fe transport
MKKALFLLCLFLAPLCLQAQHTLRGSVSDTSGTPIPYTTVSLLKPEDSTLAFFGIVNAEGNFEIKNVAADKYLLQAGFMGFKTYYHQLTVPVANEHVGRIVLKSLAKELAEVEISTEKIPLLIKKDTIEYNAGAFKTRPDASTEELLKKLPGIEVDRAGNIKAQGEGVNKVLVDGKEFFGDDPKVATKNLPADAIKKVQVFDKKSDAAEFTGFDDGSRERTINLMLKDGKKSGYFGDMQAGVGTNERYKLNAKLYKFTKKTQFAALGLLNNINEAGFSVQDYINFSGGIRNLLSGGADNLGRSFANAPVDFGRPVTGQITSGAAGLNYSYEYGKNRRVALSYLGNGSDKKLDQQSYVQNFTNTETFVRNSNEKEIERNYAHRLTANWRDDLDSSQQVTLYANAGLTESRESSEGLSKSLVRDVVLNQLDSRNTSRGNGVSANGRTSYLKRLDGNLSVLKASGTASYTKDVSKTQWQNLTSFFGGQMILDNQFQNVTQDDQNYTGTLSSIYNLKKGFYLEPEVTAGLDNEHLIRRQGPQNNEAVYIDSISPDFQRMYQFIRPELSLRRAQQKVRYGLSVAYERGLLTPEMVGTTYATRSFGYLLPAIDWENNYSMGKRLNFSYNSSVNAPSARQLLPVPNITSPLSRSYGNINLRPEYAHTARFGWLWFDQFSFTSLFTSLGGTYTKDKINTSRIIYPNLSEERTLVNVSDDYRVNAGVSYNTPVRKLGITFNASLDESMNKGINLVNSVSNQNTTWTHGLKLGVGNRKKDKFDIEVGVSGSSSDARYSIDRNLNNVFFSLTGFTEMSYRPNDHWYFGVTADVTQYNARSFKEAIVVPLLKSQVSYYFMKFNRGVLTMEGFDLLNQNKSIQRISELNYLSEVRSNVIGQYFMLSFKYRLSKAGKDPNVLDINVRQR